MSLLLIYIGMYCKVSAVTTCPGLLNMQLHSLIIVFMSFNQSGQILPVKTVAIHNIKKEKTHMKLGSRVGIIDWRLRYSVSYYAT